MRAELYYILYDCCYTSPKGPFDRILETIPNKTVAKQRV